MNHYFTLISTDDFTTPLNNLEIILPFLPNKGDLLEVGMDSESVSIEEIKHRVMEQGHKRGTNHHQSYLLVSKF